MAGTESGKGRKTAEMAGLSPAGFLLSGFPFPALIRFFFSPSALIMAGLTDCDIVFRFALVLNSADCRRLNYRPLAALLAAGASVYICFRIALYPQKWEGIKQLKTRVIYCFNRKNNQVIL